MPCEEALLVASGITSAIAASILTFVSTVFAAVLSIISPSRTIVTTGLTVISPSRTVVATVLTVVAITTDGKLDVRLDVKKKVPKRSSEE